MSTGKRRARPPPRQPPPHHHRLSQRRPPRTPARPVRTARPGRRLTRRHRRPRSRLGPSLHLQNRRTPPTASSASTSRNSRSATRPRPATNARPPPIRSPPSCSTIRVPLKNLADLLDDLTATIAKTPAFADLRDSRPRLLEARPRNLSQAQSRLEHILKPLQNSTKSSPPRSSQ